VYPTCSRTGTSACGSTGLTGGLRLTLQVIKVSIEIIDINDNAPVFGSDHVVFDIVEATQLGSVYVIQAATDIDSPPYGIQKYELDSESGKFGLQISTKLDGSQEVKLCV